MAYQRTAEQRAHDRAASREFENHVAELMGDWVHTEFESTTKLDIWIPGAYLDIKEKRQPLTARWQLLDRVAERDLFVIDELSVRKALDHWPEAYFLLRDVPGGDRLFLTSIGHLVTSDRVRRDRAGKGKWIVNLNNFRPIARVEDVLEVVRSELVSMPWKQSPCLSLSEPVPQI